MLQDKMHKNTTEFNLALNPFLMPSTNVIMLHKKLSNNQQNNLALRNFLCNKLEIFVPNGG